MFSINGELIMEKQRLPEKECPECKGKIEWKVVRSNLGSPQYNGHCSKCAIVFRDREAPQITEGKKLEREGEIKGKPINKMTALDRRITRLPCDVQIGILRERQS